MSLEKRIEHLEERVLPNEREKLLCFIREHWSPEELKREVERITRILAEVDRIRMGRDKNGTGKEG